LRDLDALKTSNPQEWIRVTDSRKLEQRHDSANKASREKAVAANAAPGTTSSKKKDFDGVGVIGGLVKLRSWSKQKANQEATAGAYNRTLPGAQRIQPTGPPSKKRKARDQDSMLADKNTRRHQPGDDRKVV
jgi:hypothetical protein